MSKRKMIYVIMILTTLVMGLSYGAFVFSTDPYRSTEMLVSTLTYGIEINTTGGSETIDGTNVSLKSGETSTIYLKVTSLNNISSKYGVEYKIISGSGTVKYASNTGWLPTGKINKVNVGTYEKEIKIVISATSDMIVKFNVIGGYSYNDLTEVTEGYTRITEIYDGIIEYKEDLKTIISKETSNNVYGGEAINNYLQYPKNEDNTKNIWRLLGYYSSVDGIKIVSNQTSKTTQSNIVSSLESFYNTLEKTNDYVLSTDKFNCTNTTCVSSSYSNVGLLSVSEYDILGGVNSYLASSESYFGLDNTTVKNITSNSIEDTTSSTSSGLRPSIYLKNNVKVTGSGTVSDPYRLTNNGDLVIASATLNGVALDTFPTNSDPYIPNSVTCTNGSEGVWNTTKQKIELTTVNLPTSCVVDFKEGYTVTLTAENGTVSAPVSKSVGRDGVASFTVTPNSEYRLDLANTSCDGGAISSINKTSGEVSIEKIIKDQACSVKDIVLKQYTLTLTISTGVSKIYYKINGATSYTSASSTQNLNVDYGSTYYYYGVASTGYTIDSCTEASPCSGTMGSGAISKTLSATKNTYQVTLAVTNGTGGGTKTIAYGGSVSFDVSPDSGYISALSSNGCGGKLSGNTYTISNVTSSKSCSIQFAEARNETLYNAILADNPTKTTRSDFSTTFTSNTTGTLYKATEKNVHNTSDTTVYYYAGNTTNNWVKFAGFYWRIIRTNADGSVRLLYHGTSTDSTEAYIGTSKFNVSSNDPMYVGYMYGTTGSLANNRTNTNNSTIKTAIDTWYQNNLTNYTPYLSTTAVYCNDRNLASGSTYSTTSTFYYAARGRLETNKTPSYNCTTAEDAFSVENTSAKLTYPIGLMTADEIVYAGGKWHTNLSSPYAWYYLNSAGGSSVGSTMWWLLSAGNWYYGSSSYRVAGVFSVYGSDTPGRLNNYDVDYNRGVRPTVSVKSETLISGGIGTPDNPYIID